jgi:hypothetical protein
MAGVMMQILGRPWNYDVRRSSLCVIEILSDQAWPESAILQTLREAVSRTTAPRTAHPPLILPNGESEPPRQARPG